MFVENNDDIDVQWAFFLETYNHVVKNYIPIKQIKIGECDKHSSGVSYDRDTRKAMNHKDRLWNRYIPLEVRTAENYAALKNAEISLKL